MTTRREFLAVCAGAGALLAGLPAFAAKLTDDGLYTEEWFLESFLDLAEDLREAANQGKRFAIMWEQRGCPYCQETHLVNFARPDINSFVRENFVILQLNMFGSRTVTDFDGEALEERELARKYGVRFSPTIQFFPDDPAAIDGKAGNKAEVVRMPGYLRPPHFLAMFKFVREQAYQTSSLRDYLKQVPR
jgi:thioredoxin-related protein